MQISIKITGNQETMKKLKRLGSKLHDNTDSMKDIGTNAAEYYAGRAWTQQGSAFGNKWLPLKAKTTSSRLRSSKRGGKITQRANTPLEGRGDMRSSFVASSSRNDVIVTNEADYFKYHQSSLPRKKLPRRQMIGVNSYIKNMVHDIIKRDIKKKINTA